MKPLTFFLFALFLISSCTTQRKCLRKFPNVASYDSIYIERLDTFKIILPGDSVKIVTKVPCDNFELIQQNGRLTQSLKVVNGILSSYINIKPDTIYKFKTNTITKTSIVKVPEKIKYVPKFVKYLALLGGISLLIIIVYLGLKIRSKILG